MPTIKQTYDVVQSLAENIGALIEQVKETRTGMAADLETMQKNIDNVHARMSESHNAFATQVLSRIDAQITALGALLEQGQ